jgi:hypothetical protein
MGVRTTVVSTVVAAALCFPMAGVAAAQDKDCEDFPTEAAAQAEYNKNPADPYDLDRDNDGRACEILSGGGTTVIIYEDNSDRAPTPTRGVETGAGGTADLVTAAEETADDGSGPLVPLGIVGGAVLAAGGLVLVRRRSVRKGS